jgi:hypothetical protein
VIKKKFVANARSLKKTTDDDIFEHLQFKDGKTYQVQIKQIEKLTGLTFDWKNVIRPFKLAEPKALGGTSIAKPGAKARSLAKARGAEPGKLGNMLMKVKVSGLTL